MPTNGTREMRKRADFKYNTSDAPIDRTNVNSSWDNKFYVRIYKAAVQGMSDAQVARMLGVKPDTFATWRKRDRAVRDALEQGRGKKAVGPSGKRTGKSLAEYVFGRLPPDYRKLWRRLEKAWEVEDGERLVEGLMAGQGKRARQYLFFNALIGSNFNKTEAMRKLGIHVQTYNYWMRTDESFAELFRAFNREFRKDFVEGSLMGLIAQGDQAAIIFANKTLNRDRGYDPKVTVVHEGTVTHAHVDMERVIDMLSPKAQREVLRAVRQLEAGQVKALPERAGDVVDAEFSVVGESN